MKTLDINLAKTMSRHEWIATWVAYQTRTKAGQSLAAGMQVKKVRGGWVYRFANSVGDCCRVTTADILYDMIRRNDLGYFVRDAENIRIDVLTA